MLVIGSPVDVSEGMEIEKSIILVIKPELD